MPIWERYWINYNQYSKRLVVHAHMIVTVSGLILGLLPANERRIYFVTMSLISWMQA